MKQFYKITVWISSLVPLMTRTVMTIISIIPATLRVHVMELRGTFVGSVEQDFKTTCQLINTDNIQPLQEENNHEVTNVPPVEIFHLQHVKL